MDVEDEPASNIEIYLRMRPQGVLGRANYKLNEEQNCVQWSIPRQAHLGMVNHQREHYNFGFTGIFDMDIKQDVIFERVAHKVILGALDGYNGTIFAYGQTGSGKTYTITGGAEKYVERGIIPRAISLMFSDLAKRTEYTYILYFSYLEIYNEMGYDLLDPDHETKALEDLPKVTMMEDEENRIHLRNLSMHLAANEEEALNLLFIGDTNRMISATPMNMASSRSHCIFTTTIEARKVGEDVVRRSKLHLVDLAGSERVSKTKVDGQILKEAKYINLSLHFLEQVIIALQERSQGKPRDHIPYRNSMMTSVLRDSLGGNCQTVMIATVSIAQEQLEETISTCRFAQRVAMVSNKVVINEEIDPSLLIKRLKQEICDLKNEITLLRVAAGNQLSPRSETSHDVEIIRNDIVNYVKNDSSDAELQFKSSVSYIKNAFSIFKSLLKQCENFELDSCRKMVSHPISQEATLQSLEPPELKDLHKQIQDLKFELQQRDNEINILVSFIRKHENDTLCTSARSLAVGSPITRDNFVHKNTVESIEREPRVNTNDDKTPQDRPSSATQSFLPCPTTKLVLGRKQCFEVFCSNYSMMSSIQENKSILKSKYSEAKTLGDHVNKARERINELKSEIEKQRVDRAMQDLVEKKDATQCDFEDDRMVKSIDDEKRKYKEGFAKLRDLKKEIEHLHIMLERSRVKLHEDFETWLSLLQTPSTTPKSIKEHLLLPTGDEGTTKHPLSACSTSSTMSDISMLMPSSNRNGSASGPSVRLDTKNDNDDNKVRFSPRNKEDYEHLKDSAKPVFGPWDQSFMQDTTGLSCTTCRDARRLSTTHKRSNSMSPRQVAHSSSPTSENSTYPKNARNQNMVSAKESGPTDIKLTGNTEIDADILAFYGARSDILSSHPQYRNLCAKG